ncbi:MAG: hypothetical protein BAJATHORv1_10612 [Candidatus Thorarchaeota archaeon]|nr:MAG: hypothetical protein BAJATHORv1_10612 [Candidatus Thorarchaeota archaeon]
MSKVSGVNELFVIHKSGLPIAHVGTGKLQIDDALFGGLLSAIENVGLSLGLEEDGALDTIRFRAYDLVYVRTENSLVVLLTDDDDPEFFRLAKEELQRIGDSIEEQGFLDDIGEITSERTARLDEIIAHSGRTIFARQDDVFIWDDKHTFQLASHKNARWIGNKLFANYFLLSPMKDMLNLPMDDLIRLCNFLEGKRHPSEILSDEKLKVHDEKLIENTVKFLHTYGIVHCFSSIVHKIE